MNPEEVAATAQYAVENGGSGGAICLAGLVIILAVCKVAWTGTLSEDVQRRNYRRDKKGDE